MSGGAKGSTALTIDDAVLAKPSDDYQTIGQVGSKVEGRSFVPITPTTDGKLFGQWAGGPSKVGVPAIYDVHTGALTKLPVGSPVKGQMIAATASARWIVWLTTSSTRLDQTPWSLFSYDTRARRTRLIATAPRTSAGTPTAPGYSWPSIDARGRVYVDAVFQIRKSQKAYVSEVPADGSAPLKRVVPGVGASASGRSLVWAAPFGRNLTVWHRDLRTGRTVRLYSSTHSPCSKISGLATAANRTALLLECKTVPKSEERVLIFGGDLRQKVTIHGSRLGYLRMTASFTSFAVGAGPYRQLIYSFHDQRLLQLGKGQMLGDTPGVGSLIESALVDPATRTTVTRLLRIN